MREKRARASFCTPERRSRILHIGLSPLARGFKSAWPMQPSRFGSVLRPETRSAVMRSLLRGARLEDLAGFEPKGASMLKIWSQALSRAATTAAAGVAAVMIAASPASAELTKIKVGHLVALDMAPLFVAHAGDCFAQNGLEAETVFFANPGDNNAALAGGAIDFSINPFTLPFFAANSGVPIRVIAA
ncbi:MAG: ABC transporter substrate-binding protein, partial [Pseudomonadota bacterium]